MDNENSVKRNGGCKMDSSILSKAYQQPATNILADVCALAAKMDNVIDLSRRLPRPRRG